MGAVETLTRERVDIAKALKALADKAIEENGGEFTAEQLTEVDNLKGKFLDKGNDIERAKSLVATHDEVDAFLSANDANELNSEALAGTRTGFTGRKGGQSIGTVFTKSDAYRGLMNRFPNGISDTTKGINTGPVQIGGLKSLLTGADREQGAGVLVQPDRLGIVPYPSVMPNIRSLITTGTTTSDRIEYAQVLPVIPDAPPQVPTSSNNAVGVPEATNVVGTSGTKPMSGIKFRKASADIITIAHWIAATKRALSDAAQLRTLIDAFLREGIERQVQRLILAGDKASPLVADSEEWDGLLNTEGVQDVTFDTDVFTVSRRMIRQVAAVGGYLSAFAVSPATAETLDLLRDGNDRFFGAGPFALGPNTLWGRPRVEVVDLPDDVIVGGEWSTCVLWDRETTTLTATDAHADFFTRNLIAILAEARAGFGVMNPQLMAIGHTEAVAP